MEIIRFAKYYKSKGLDGTVVLWGAMGIILGEKNKIGQMRYDNEIMEYFRFGIHFKCCVLAANLIGLDESELINGVKLIESYIVADILLDYKRQDQLIFSL